MQEIVLRVEVFTFRTRKRGIEHPERGGYLVADVQGSIFGENDNPSTQAATRKARIRARAKAGYRGELLVKLYVMDFIEAFDEAV